MVCTANQVRSPIAEQLMRNALTFTDLPWVVTSAGTDAIDGGRLHDITARVLRERRLSDESWRTHRLRASTIAECDLILTASRENRSFVVRLVPRALSRTFTILQFSRLVTNIDSVVSARSPTAGAELVTKANAVRNSLQPVSADVDEVVDPIGNGLRAFRRCADTIDRALTEVLRRVDRNES